MDNLYPKRTIRRWHCFAVILILAFGSAPLHPAAKKDAPLLVLVLSEERSPYTTVAETFAQTLPTEGTPESFRLEYVEPAELAADDPRIARASAVVGFGTQALRMLVQLDTTVPILSTLVPNAAFTKLTGHLEQTTYTIRALHLDQPIDRQMALIRLILPQEEPTVAVLLGPSSRERKSRLVASARDHGLAINTATVGPGGHESATEALNSLLPEADVLLAIPDPAVYNRVSIRSLLLMTFRHDIPVIGYSESFVKAGAVAAVVTPIEAIGRESAQLITQSRTDGRIMLPDSRFPNNFQVHINRDVAETLGVDLPAADSLEEKLRRRENEP